VPTFGNTNVGVNWQTAYTDRLYACRYTCPDAGQAQSISWWGQTAGVLIRMAIYSDNGAGAPLNLLAETGEGTTVANNWVTLAISLTLTAATVYHLAWRLNGTCAGKWDAGAANQKRVSGTGQGYGPFPATFPLPGSTGFADANSVYCTYTTAPPPAVGQPLGDGLSFVFG